MEQFVLEVQKRTATGKGAARALRRQGLIPGVVYGHHLEPMAITVEARQLQTLLRHHGTLLRLKIDGQETDPGLAALLKEAQCDPITRQILSVDLQWVSLNEPVEVEVPVTLVGEAIGVIRDGGVVDQVMHEIAISCLPTQIPEHIEVDISSLEMGDSLHVSDIVPPEGITLLAHPEDVIVTITPPVSAEELEVQVEEEAEVEVIGEKERKAKEEKAAEEDKGTAD